MLEMRAQLLPCALGRCAVLSLRWTRHAPPSRMHCKILEALPLHAVAATLLRILCIERLQGKTLLSQPRPLRTFAGFLCWLLVFVRSSAGALLLSGLLMCSGVIRGRIFRQYGIQSSLVVPPAIHMHRRPPSAQCTSKFAERCSEHLGAACCLCWPSCT